MHWIEGRYSREMCERYNKFSEAYFTRPNAVKNCTHPKQKDKLMLQAILDEMSKEDPDGLLALVSNPVYCGVLDTLLGFFTIGSFTGHWIKPGGDRQMSHVDYPCHVGSGKFWEGKVSKLQKLTTRYQRNHVLPYYSIQTVMAVDAMDVSNGSTECIPFSTHLDDLDVLVHDEEYKAKLEPRFVNITLEQGDVFLFNRGLCHRGGKNISDQRRNAAIMQCVWLFGLQQEKIDADLVIGRLQDCDEWKKMTEEEKETFRLRLEKPFPVDITQHN